VDLDKVGVSVFPLKSGYAAISLCSVEAHLAGEKAEGLCKGGARLVEDHGGIRAACRLLKGTHPQRVELVHIGRWADPARVIDVWTTLVILAACCRRLFSIFSYLLIVLALETIDEVVLDAVEAREVWSVHTASQRDLNADVK